MGYRLELDNPAYPKDEVFHVPHFPAGLVNGHQATVTDEEVEEYEAFTGKNFKTTAKGIVGMKVTEVGKSSSSSKSERGDS